MGPKIKVVESKWCDLSKLVQEGQKANEQRFSSIGLTSIEKKPKNYPITQLSRNMVFSGFLLQTDAYKQQDLQRFFNAVLVLGTNLVLMWSLQKKTFSNNKQLLQYMYKCGSWFQKTVLHISKTFSAHDLWKTFIEVANKNIAWKPMFFFHFLIFFCNSCLMFMSYILSEDEETSQQLYHRLPNMN